MRLTLACFFKRTVPGHIHRGKKRMVRPVGRLAMDGLIREYERQEKNMFWLRHSYLTMEESSGHTKELNKRAKLIDHWNAEHLKNKMKPHVTLEERLMHLKVQESWD